jgi:hypothetical protein
MTAKTVRCLALLALIPLSHAPVLAQSTSQVTLMTAGDGSAFLPYGQGIATYLKSRGISIEVRKSAGSNENLSAVDASATTMLARLEGDLLPPVLAVARDSFGCCNRQSPVSGITPDRTYRGQGKIDPNEPKRAWS